jgi:hypothetical protein
MSGILTALKKSTLYALASLAFFAAAHAGCPGSRF